MPRKKKQEVGAPASLQSQTGENRQYELALVVSPEVKSEKRKEAIAKFTKFIEDAAGSVRDVHELGLRDLAYPIQHTTSGWYAILQIVFPPSRVNSLEVFLGREKDVLRHLIVRSDEQ